MNEKTAKALKALAKALQTANDACVGDTTLHDYIASRDFSFGCESSEHGKSSFSIQLRVDDTWVYVSTQHGGISATYVDNEYTTIESDSKIATGIMAQSIWNMASVENEEGYTQYE
jgi:hypothetical protein